MPGIINAHAMPMQQNAKFIRMVHLGNNKGSLYLSDLDSDENKRNEYKIPVYIPYGMTVDILLTDRTLTSYQQGSIRGFVKNGWAEAFVVQNIKVRENVEQVVPVYDVSIDDDLLTIDTTNGDVLLNLPQVPYEISKQSSTQGKRFTFKKISDDENKIILTAAVGDTIEGLLNPLEVQDPNGFVTLQRDINSGWWVVGRSTTTIDPVDPSPDDYELVEEIFDIDNTTTTSVSLSSVPISGTDKVFWNGVDLTRGASYDYTLSGSVITFHADVKLLPDDRIKVTFQKLI